MKAYVFFPSANLGEGPERKETSPLSLFLTLTGEFYTQISFLQPATAFLVTLKCLKLEGRKGTGVTLSGGGENQVSPRL